MRMILYLVVDYWYCIAITTRLNFLPMLFLVSSTWWTGDVFFVHFGKTYCTVLNCENNKNKSASRREEFSCYPPLRIWCCQTFAKSVLGVRHHWFWYHIIYQFVCFDLRLYHTTCDMMWARGVHTVLYGTCTFNMRIWWMSDCVSNVKDAPTEIINLRFDRLPMGPFASHFNRDGWGVLYGGVAWCRIKCIMTVVNYTLSACQSVFSSIRRQEYIGSNPSHLLYVHQMAYAWNRPRLCPNITVLWSHL